MLKQTNYCRVNSLTELTQDNRKEVTDFYCFEGEREVKNLLGLHLNLDENALIFSQKNATYIRAYIPSTNTFYRCIDGEKWKTYTPTKNFFKLSERTCSTCINEFQFKLTKQCFNKYSHKGI